MFSDASCANVTLFENHGQVQPMHRLKKKVFLMKYSKILGSSNNTVREGEVKISVYEYIFNYVKHHLSMVQHCCWIVFPR